MKEKTAGLIGASKRLASAIRQDAEIVIRKGRFVRVDPTKMARKIAEKRRRVAAEIREARRLSEPGAARAGHRAGYFAHHLTEAGKRPT